MKRDELRRYNEGFAQAIADITTQCAQQGIHFSVEFSMVVDGKIRISRITPKTGAERS